MEKFYFEPYNWNKPIFNMNLIRFLSEPLLPKIIMILLLKYWIKIWGPSLSQYCKGFWMANCTGNNFILNSTSEISIYVTCIWYFFPTIHFCQKIINIFLFIYCLKTWGPSRFWLANCIWKIFILNRTPEISLFLTWIWYFFLSIHYC